MELIFVFAIVFVEIFLLHFSKIMEIVRTFGIDTFMDTEEFTVFLGSQSVTAMRADKAYRSCNDFTGTEGLTTDLALVLSIAAIVVVDEMVWSTTERTDGIFRNGFTIATLNRLEEFSVLPLIVLQKELPVLFDKGFNDRELIDFEFLILG